MARRRDKGAEVAEGQEVDGAAGAEMADPGATAAEQQESLERIERGGITVAAERRLSELREKGGLFTSDLSVNGWALAHQLGLRPLSQVMGSSIYQMGYQGARLGPGRMGWHGSDLHGRAGHALAGAQRGALPRARADGRGGDARRRRRGRGSGHARRRKQLGNRVDLARTHGLRHRSKARGRGVQRRHA